MQRRRGNENAPSSSSGGFVCPPGNASPRASLEAPKKLIENAHARRSLVTGLFIPAAHLGKYYDRAMLRGAIQYNAIKLNTIQCYTVPSRRMQNSAIQFSATQYGAIHTIEYNEMQQVK